MAYLIEWQVKAAIIVALMVIVFAVFLAKDTMFKRNRFWLLGTLIVPWIVPLIAMPASIKTLLFAPARVVDPVTLSIPVATEVNDVIQPAAPIGWPGVILWLYLVVSLVFAVRFVWGYIYLIKLKRKSKKLKFKGLDLYLLIDEDINPFSFFQSVFVPESVMEQVDRDHIINHERAHCRQWHSVDIALAEWMLILHWWNPFAWWLRKLIAQNHEFCVDQAMMQISEEPRQYQYSLINYLPGSKSLKLVNNFSQSLIKKRIIMMNIKKTDKKLFEAVKSLMVVVITFIALVAFTNPDKTENPKKKQQQVENIQSTADLRMFFAQNIKYPAVAVENNFTGDVTVNVAISKKGMVGKTKSGSATGGNVVKPGEVVVTAYAAEGGVTPESSASIADLEKEVNRVMAKLPSIDDANLQGKTLEFKVKFVLQEREKKVDLDSPIIYIDGERYKGDLNAISPEEIASVNVLKGEAAVQKYGEDHGDGVIEISTKAFVGTEKQNNLIKIKDTGDTKNRKEEEDIAVGFKVNIQDKELENQPLYVVDGKVLSSSEISALDNTKIESVTVNRGKEMFEKYGDKAKNGVLIITMKK